MESSPPIQIGSSAKIAKYPGISQIKEYCGLSQSDKICPNVKATDYRHYLILGSCKHGATCEFPHITATNNQATTILQKFEKLLYLLMDCEVRQAMLNNASLLSIITPTYTV